MRCSPALVAGRRRWPESLCWCEAMRLEAWPLVGRGEELELLDGLVRGDLGSVVVDGGIDSPR